MKLTKANWFKDLCLLVALLFFCQTILPTAHNLPMPKISLDFGPAVAYAQEPEWLASTVDANYEDRFIQEKLAEIGPGVDAAFAFVRDEIGFEAYTGSLRGARGTMWSGAGNSLDQASLLIALLRAPGIPVRYARGTLSDENAKKLLSMFPVYTSVVGCPAADTPRSAPTDDSELLNEAREHYWVEFEDSTGVIAADPSFSGALIGQTNTSSQDSFYEVPDSLRHSVIVRLKAEIAGGLSGLAGGPKIQVPIEETFNTVELVGKPITLGHFVTSHTPPAMFYDFTSHTYSPYIIIGQNDEDISDDHIIRGKAYQKYVNLFTRVAAILSPAEAHAAAPVADAGSDKSLSKNQPVGSSVALDGSSSYDPDGDSLTYEWYGPFATTSGSSISKSISEGMYTVSLIVDDGMSRSDIDTAEITIEPCFNISARAKSGKVQLTWTHQDGTERYDVYRSDESDPFSLEKIGETTSTYSTYLDDTVLNETTYLYVVGAYDGSTWCYSNVTSSHPTASRTRANYAPIIYSSPITHGTVGIIYSYDVNAVDPNLDALTCSLADSPADMEVDPDTGRITWTPAAAGSYDVTVEVSDGQGGTDNQSFTIVVADVDVPNSLPHTVDDSVATSEDTTVTTGNLLSNDWDEDNDVLSISGFTLPAHGALAYNDDGTFTFTPDADFHGADRFTYTVSDGNGGTAEADVLITVNPVNDPPQVGDDAASTDEDTPISINVLANDTDVDGDSLTVAEITQGANGSVAVNPDGTIHYTPGPNFNGQDAFTYTVSDNRGGIATATVNLTVTPVNDAPIAVPQTVSLDEDSSLAITLKGSDIDGDSFTYTVVADPTHGTLSGMPPNVTYTPAANYYGPDTFSFTVNDGTKDSAPAEVLITVASVNNPPLADAGPDQQAGIGDAVTLNGAGSTDADGDTLEFLWTLISVPENSSAALSDPTAVDPVLTPDRPGTYVVQLVVYDGFENSLPDTARIEATSGPLQLSPAALNLSTLASGTFTVSLAEPAGPGGQSVNLISGNPSIAKVPDSVTIAQGETETTFEVTTLVSDGSTTITASADGIGEHSATVNVSLRALELTVMNPLIGTDRMSQAEIQLASPAPAGGMTVNITTSAPAVAGVNVNSVEIAEGHTTAAFQVNGLTVGTADISVSAPGYASASTDVHITKEMILLGVLETLAPNQIGSLPVILSKPAPDGGIAVSLFSSDPSVAAISPSVTVEEGETIASTNAQVTGVSFGTVTITASAPGYAPDYLELPVTLILSFTPTSVTVTAGETENITLGLSAPAPSTGLTLNLNSDDPSLATVPASIMVPSGQSSVQVPVTGIAKGYTHIYAGAPGIESIDANVRINPPPSINLYSVNLGYNLQLRISFSLQKAAPAGGVTVTLTSADSSKLLLSTSHVTVGSASISFNVSAGVYSEQFYLQSLADSGKVQITASAPGYADSFSEITLVPTGFWIGNGTNCPVLCPDSFEVSIYDSYGLTVGIYSPYAIQTIRAGLEFEVPLVSSNPSVGELTDASVVFSGNKRTAYTRFNALEVGTTTLSVGQPPGFTPPFNQDEVTATVIGASVDLPPSVIVGEHLQKYLDFDLGGSPPGLVDVTIEVDDESIALISADPKAAGARQITLTDMDVNQLPTIYVQGLQQGTTTLSVSATGYTSATTRVDVYPSGFYFNTYSSSFDLFVSETEYISVGVAALSPGTLNFEIQDIRGGYSVAVEVTSSNPAVGVMTTSPLEFTAGNHYVSTGFEALAAGSSTLSLIPPPGFYIYSNGYHPLTANVSIPSVSVRGGPIIDGTILIGKDLQSGQLSCTIDVYPDTPVEITATVAGTSIALISSIRTEVGGQSFSDTENDPTYFRFYLQGLRQGSTTLTVSAPGYQASTYPVQVLPSGFILGLPYGDFTTDVFAENTRVRVFPGFLYPDTHFYGPQEVRAGLTVDVPVVSSDTRVGVLTDNPLTFLAGLYPSYLETYFDPIAGGTTTLSVIQPDGFTTPADRTSYTATVVAPDILMKSSLTVGKDLQQVLLIGLESAPPVPVDLTVSVVDANTAIISDSRTTMGTSTVTFHDVSDTTNCRVYVQGLAVGDTELRAQAIGFNDAVTEVAVDPSALYIAWPYNNFLADATDPNYEVNVFTALLDRTTLAYSCPFQDDSSCWKSPNCTPLEVHRCSHPEIRGGLTLQVPIQSSDPSVGVLAAGSLTFVGGQDNIQIVELDLVGSGEMELSITPPAGFSLPANRDTRIQGTVRGIGSSPSQEAYIGRHYSYDAEASYPILGYVFSLETAPAGMTIDETTGIIQWMPDESQLGDHSVTVQLHDSYGLVDIQSYTLSVLAVDPNNRAPMIMSSPVESAVVETPYAYSVKAVDYDEGDILSLSLTTAPDGMSINAATGLIEWTPAAAQAGEHDVVLTVQDAAGATATQQYLLTVLTLEDLDQDYDGFTVNQGDCDDTDPSINPEALDIAGNGIDEDCDGGDALTSISMDSGIAHIRIPLGTSKSIGYTINFDAVGTDTYNLSMDQDILPDNDGITITPGFPAAVETEGSKSMHLGQAITGNTLGTYQVISMVTVNETGQTATVPVEIEVTAGEFVPVLKPMGSVPDAIPLSQTTDVMFKTIVTGIKKAPETIEVEKVDESGASLGVLGSLVDDGTDGDLSAGDYVYSATFPIDAPADDGTISFRAKATFADVEGTFYSDIYHLGVTRFPTDFKLTHPSSIVMDPASGAPIISNRITLGFVEGTTADAIETIVRSVDGSVIGIMHSIGVFSVEIPDTRDGTGVSSALSALQEYPQVEFAEPVHIGKVNGVRPDDEIYPQQHQLVRTRVDEAWVMADGTGVTIAILDTGIDPDHPDLENKLRKDRNIWGANFVLRPGESPFEPRDDHFHGTHMAGIAAAQTDNGIGIAGTAWNSTIFPIRVAYWSRVLSILTGEPVAHFDEDALYRGIWYAAGIGVKVINVSLATERHSTALSRIVSYAHDQGSLVVASAGNDNNSNREYPAAYRQAIAVGATMHDPADDDINVRWQESPTVGSNHGGWVDIAAPGHYVQSTIPTYEAAISDLDAICPPEDRFFIGCYWGFSGTSAATPIVSGAAALLWSVHPEMDNDDIRRRLLQSANPMPGAGLGAGHLDIFEALFNGGFEMGGLRGWEATSRTGLPSWLSSPYDIPAAYSVSELGPLDTPYNPDKITRRTPNRRMALIGNDGNERTSTTLSQTFTVQPGVEGTYLSYDYIFATEEFPDYYNCYFDYMFVSVEAPSGSNVYFMVKDMTDFFPTQIDWFTADSLDIGVPGLITRPYDLEKIGCYVWQSSSITGVVYEHVRDTYIPFSEGPGEYTISISIWDEYDSIVDSVLLIDNVRFKQD